MSNSNTRVAEILIWNISKENVVLATPYLCMHLSLQTQWRLNTLRQGCCDKF